MRLGGILFALFVVLASAWVLHGAVAGGIIYTSRSTQPSDERAVDVATTHRYLGMVRTTLVAIRHNMGAVDGDIDQVVANVRSQCPVVAAHAPINLTRWRVEAIISEELAIAGVHADTTLTADFLKHVIKLRWYDQQVTNIIQTSARAISMQSRLREPELCMPLRQWASGGFYEVPHDMAVFSHRVESLSEMSSLLPNILARYEGRLHAGRLRALRRLERAVGTDLRSYILRARAQILLLVGLSQ
jgi:hypothetical protein